MDPTLLALIILIIGLLSALFAEWYLHQKSLHRIPIRVHVNGTRGKSSVTRLIAAGLRAGGLSTLGKTTGSDPRILDLYGKDRKIVRLRNASIGEQIHFLRYFSKFKPQAVVLECMAVQPQLQWVTEHLIVKSTHSVITNARMDHIEEMGYRLEDIAKSLSNTVPFKGRVFTAEVAMLPVIQKIADERGSEVHAVTGEMVKFEDMQGFTYIEHQENVALALEVCQALGVERETALDGMRHSTPDPGALKIWYLKRDDRTVSFVIAFAANDPDSTLNIWTKIKDYPGLEYEKVAVFLNTRSDRISRTSQLLELVMKEIKPDFLIVRGDSLERYKKDYFGKMPWPIQTFAENTNPAKVADALVGFPDKTLLYGIGNIVGSGFAILDEARKFKRAL